MSLQEEQEEDYFIRLNVLIQCIDWKEAELDELFTHRMDQSTRTRLADSLVHTLDTCRCEYQSIFAKLSAELAYSICGMCRDVSVIIGQYSS